MKIFLVSQSRVTGYDTYDSMVVIARDEQAAREMHPSPSYSFNRRLNQFGIQSVSGEWHAPLSRNWPDSPDLVEVEQIGVADLLGEPRIVCTSFNAG